jgi:hypothetical protein
MSLHVLKFLIWLETFNAFNFIAQSQQTSPDPIAIG